MMRQVTAEQIKRKLLELRNLEADWDRMNRPMVNKTLRDSIWTKLLEMRAAVEAMEAQMRCANRAKAKLVGAEVSE